MATRTRPSVSIMDQLEAGIQELDEVLAGKRALRKVVVTVHAPSVYSAEDIKNLRCDLNMSQAEFAELLEVSPKTVQAWEHGVRSPSYQIRQFLDVYSKPEMRDSLRFARPPIRRRKVDGSAAPSKRRVVAAAPENTRRSVSAKGAIAAKRGRSPRSADGTSVSKKR